MERRDDEAIDVGGGILLAPCDVGSLAHPFDVTAADGGLRAFFGKALQAGAFVMRLDGAGQSSGVGGAARHLIDEILSMELASMAQGVVLAHRPDASHPAPHIQPAPASQWAEPWIAPVPGCGGSARVWEPSRSAGREAPPTASSRASRASFPGIRAESMRAQARKAAEPISTESPSVNSDQRLDISEPARAGIVVRELYMEKRRNLSGRGFGVAGEVRPFLIRTYSRGMATS
jgi:hypothetical protein